MLILPILGDPWSGKQISEEKHVDLLGIAWQKWIQTSQSSREDRFEQRGELAGFVLDGPACKRLNLLTSRQKEELSRRLKDRRPPNPSAFVMSTVLTYWSTI